MLIAGIIAEYNPFHNGHAYHIERTRELTDADYVVVLMSGSHVQRGEPAVFDKYRRTRKALAGGADAVFEMPAAFSTASAREFASYGVSFFSKIGADVISFGSESGDIDAICSAAALLEQADEDSEFNALLKDYLKSGASFPEARAKALSKIAGASSSALLSSPNNILGLEYVSAALRLKNQGLITRIPEFMTITREGAGYHDEVNPVTSSADSNSFTSATAERKRILEAFKSGSLSAEESYPVFPDDYSSLLNYKLFDYSLYSSKLESEGFSDLNEAILGKLTRLVPDRRSFSETIEVLKSRDLTYTRISRALLHIILGITSADMAAFKEHGYASYARILGFRRESSPVLKELHRRSEIPVITKLADAASVIDDTGFRLLNQEIYASHIYQDVRARRADTFANEYRQGPVIF